MCWSSRKPGEISSSVATNHSWSRASASSIEESIRTACPYLVEKTQTTEFHSNTRQNLVFDWRCQCLLFAAHRYVDFSYIACVNRLDEQLHVVSRWPHLLPLVYTVQALFLIPLRFLSYKRKSWHYSGAWSSAYCFFFLLPIILFSVYDLCYFVNLLTLLYLWVFPSSIILFTVCYMLSHGPLIFAIILWRNSLVFHSEFKCLLDAIGFVFFSFRFG